MSHRNRGGLYLLPLMSRMNSLPAVLALLAVPATAHAIPAFEGAQGVTASIEGGRGGAVLRVTTLDASGPGSLQAALDTPGPRIIVFEVSGVIEADIITIPHGDVTIAGQTAPGAGITIDGRLYSHYEADPPVSNVVIRHVRVRPTVASGPGEQFDAIQMSRASQVLLDHVSASFGVDETIDWFEADDVTMQWSTVESSVIGGNHPEGDHNYGVIQGPDGGRASIHHNLFAHHRNRCPALATGPSEVRGNVVYNVRHGFIHHNPAAGHFSIVGNSYVAGDYPDLFPFFFDDEAGGSDPTLAYYLADNFIDDPGVFTGVVENPWSEPFAHPNFDTLGLPESYRVTEDFDFGSLPGHVAVTDDGSSTSMTQVLDCAGAWPRDVVTLRSVQDTIDRTGTWGAMVPPDLLEGLTPQAPPPDGDQDGMPDDWEMANGLDPADGSDHGTVMEGGYTAIEVYLDDRAAELVGDACPAFGGPGGNDEGPLDDTGGETGAGGSTSSSMDTEAADDAGTISGSGSAAGGTGPASDAGASGDGAGCGCRSTPAPTSVFGWALVLLGLIARRRR